jgi:hypothetical protein
MIGAVTNRIILIVSESEAAAVTEACAWVIDHGLCELVIVQDERYDEALEGLKAKGLPIKRLVEGRWEAI